MEPTTLEDLLPHLVALILKIKRNKQKSKQKKHEQEKTTIENDIPISLYIIYYVYALNVYQFVVYMLN